ncbi:MAG: NAD-dependent deacetylase [Acidimicrobiales bacterium]
MSDVDLLRTMVRSARNVMVLTGAGISTDSGIPDFRGPQGVWTKNPEAEKMATLQHYMADVEVRKRAWRHRLDAAAWEAKPNEGHRALLTLEQLGKLDVLVTQNVDGLHNMVGHSLSRIIEIHGTMRDAECLACGYRDDMQKVLDRVRDGDQDPACPDCHGILKSATISFGQGLREADLLRAEEAAVACDLILAIGSTLSVYPIAAVVPRAHATGARVAIVNGAPTEMDGLADLILRGSISQTLSELVDGM